MDPGATNALRHILLGSNYELIPLKNVMDQAGFLPAGAQVLMAPCP
jgi:hypothetical protein